MTDWEKVCGSQETKPTEFDTTSSDIVVYQRRNIKEVEVTTETTDDESETHTEWQYEERTMTKDEFNEVYANQLVAQLTQARADIDFLSAMTGTDL